MDKTENSSILSFWAFTIIEYELEIKVILIFKKIYWKNNLVHNA